MASIKLGSFIADGSPVLLDMQAVPSKITLYNVTQASSTANPGVVKKAEWLSNMDADSAIVVKNTDGAATDEMSKIANGGFTPYKGLPLLGSEIQGASVSQASPAVVTANGHGLRTGDQVRLYSTTGMLQISGMDFVVTVTGANTFTIPINTSGFAAAATNVVVRKHLVPLQFVPVNKFITGISKASSGRVSTSIPDAFATGDKVRLIIPPEFGMTELNNKVVTVTDVSSTSFDIDVNTTNFTTFAFPASAGVPFTFAQVVPVSGSFENASVQGVTLGAQVCGAASDEIKYIAEFEDIY